VQIGAEELLYKYKCNSLKIAEALLTGKLSAMEQEYVEDVVSHIVLKAAMFRVATEKRKNASRRLTAKVSRKAK
jgi:hypothetical protein